MRYMCVLSLEEETLLAEIGEVLSHHTGELAAGVVRVLEAAAVFHERLFTDDELSRIGQKMTEEVLDAVQHRTMYSEPDAVKRHGAHVARRGLGIKAATTVVCAWQEMCLPLVAREMGAEPVVLAARALAQYCSLFHEGFAEAFKDRILDAQDKMVLALEQSLRESEQRMAVTLRSIGDGVIATDTEGLITFMNSAAEQLTGWNMNDAAGIPLEEVFHVTDGGARKEYEFPVKSILEGEGVTAPATDTTLVTRDGAERIIADSAAPIRDEKGNILGVIIIFRDITEKKEMEENILRLKTEKLESIGILAGGIAHDFNNILTAILGNITLAQMQARDERVSSLLKEAEKASLMAKNLTQQLLTFSMGGVPVRKPAPTATLIRTTAEFALSGSKARCEISIPENIWPIDVDAGQIGQVIHNLVINADQAMPAGGVVRVSCENVRVEGGEIPVEEGNYVQIAVEDEGIGIPETHLQRVFEPYFTTKQKGSGLGLAICYSIVKHHGGCITVKSELGKGTTFCVYLPAAEREDTVKEETCTLLRGKGKILLMDDDEGILEATGEVLTFLGYSVEVARSGEEALEQYRKAQECGQPFDVVIVDLTIRGKMGGKETAQRLRELDPGVNAIVSSGYSEDPVMAHFREYGFRGVIAKPYTIEELSQTLHNVLEG